MQPSDPVAHIHRAPLVWAFLLRQSDLVTHIHRSPSGLGFPPTAKWPGHTHPWPLHRPPLAFLPIPGHCRAPGLKPLCCEKSAPSSSLLYTLQSVYINASLSPSRPPPFLPTHLQTYLKRTVLSFVDPPSLSTKTPAFSHIAARLLQTSELGSWQHAT